MAESPNPDLIARLRSHGLLTEQQFVELEDMSGFETPQALADELVQRRWLTAYQAKHLVADQLDRLELGGYRLLEPIGAGGMGEVFLARQKKLNRDVAIKLIRADFAAAHADALSRFRREALAVARLAHPNIVHIYDTDEIDGTHFIVMEYVPGVDLARMVGKSGPLPVAVAGDFVRQAALGLQHAFEAGLVHRDIKPSNLLASVPESSVASGFGLVKILDLGLARLNEEPTDLVLTNVKGVLGTPDFISPEQARDSHKADIRSDLYSLGCTLYFVLSGQVPFPDGTGVEKLMCHQLERPRSISLIRPDVPNDIQTIVGRLMKKDPRERFQTPAELAVALEKSLARLTRPVGWPPRPADASEVAPAPPSAPVVASGFSRAPQTIHTSVKSVAPANPAGLMLATNLSALSPDLLPEPKPAPFQSRLPRQSQVDLPPPPAPVIAPPPSLGAPAAPSCRVVKAATLADVAPLSTLVALQAPRVAVLQGHHAQVVTMAFAPRGRFLATGGLDHAIRMWRLDGEDTRQETAFLDPRLGEVRTLTFTPAGNELLVSSSGLGGRVWRWRWREDANDIRALERSTAAAAVVISPDGKYIAAAEGREVQVWSVAGKELRWCEKLTGRKNDISALAFSTDARLLFAGDAGGHILTWSHRWRRFRQEAAFTAHAGPVAALAYSPTKRHLATSGTDNAIRVWTNFDAVETVFTASGAVRGVVKRLQFSADGQTLFAVSDAGQAFSWRGGTGEPINDWRLNQAISTCQALADHGGVVALGRTDGAVNLYQLGADPSGISLSGSAQGTEQVTQSRR